MKIDTHTSGQHNRQLIVNNISQPGRYVK